MATTLILTDCVADNVAIVAKIGPAQGAQTNPNEKPVTNPAAKTASFFFKSRLQGPQQIIDKNFKSRTQGRDQQRQAQQGNNNRGHQTQTVRIDREYFNNVGNKKGENRKARHHPQGYAK